MGTPQGQCCQCDESWGLELGCRIIFGAVSRANMGSTRRELNICDAMIDTHQLGPVDIQKITVEKSRFYEIKRLDAG